MIACRGIRLKHFENDLGILEIARGEIIGLAGSNGAGKTTLLRYLAALDPASVTIQNSEKQQYFQPDAPLRTAMVFQHAEDNLIFGTLREDIRLGLKNTGKSPDECDIKEFLHAFLPEGSSDVPYPEMSSSERELAALASICSQKPDLLLLDEPLSRQPDRTAAEVLSHVIRQAKESGTTVILASHVPQLLNLCSRIIYLNRGQISEENNIARSLSIGSNPFSALTETIGAGDRPSRDLNCPGSLKLTEYCPDKGGEVLVSLDSVSVSHQKRPVFTDLTLALREGCLYHLTGPSGSGKSTLMLLMAGLLFADSGEIRVSGKAFPLSGKCGWSKIGKVNHQAYLNGIRRNIGFFGQHADRQLFCDTVFEDVGFAPKNFGLSGDDLKAAQVKALYRMGLPESFWQRPAAQLSIGEQRKAALAGMIAANPKMLLLDDPYAELDQDGIDALNRVIREQLDQGGTVLIAEGI